jgi:hypothetical protein
LPDHSVPATLEGGAQGVAVGGVLEQLVVGEPGGQPLQPVDEGAFGQPVLRAGPEPVARVDHDRDAGEPAGDATHDPGLGVVGVQDVELEGADRADEFAKGREV